MKLNGIGMDLVAATVKMQSHPAHNQQELANLRTLAAPIGMRLDVLDANLNAYRQLQNERHATLKSRMQQDTSHTHSTLGHLHQGIVSLRNPLLPYVASSTHVGRELERPGELRNRHSSGIEFSLNSQTAACPISCRR
jgi:hypothetical protein